MAAISDAPKKRRGPGRPFAKGVGGNRSGRPKMPEDLRAYLKANRGPMTIKALKTTDRLLGSKDQHVAARVANDWLNKVLPDATHVEEQLRAFFGELKKVLDPAAYELAVKAAARLGDAPSDDQ